MTNPVYTHQAIISADALPHSACGGTGRSVAPAADVTCPACLDLAAHRKDRTEVHDTHTIPADDEPAEVTTVEYSVRYTHPAEGVVFTDPMDTRTSGLEYLAYVAERFDAVLVNRTVTATAWVPDSGSEPIAAEVKPCPSCPHCGKAFHVEDAPAKTHDLSIVRVHGNVVIEATAEADDRAVYFQDGVATDLGRVLAALTPAQIALVIGDLTGGGK